MRCYIINLPTKSNRLARTLRELRNYAPKVSASVPLMYVACNMSDHEFDALYDTVAAWKLHGYDLSRGELACVLSHQSAMKEFLSSDDECCLIVEDDVLFSPAVGDFLENLSQHMQKCRSKPMAVLLSEAAAVRYWAIHRRVCPVKLIRPLEIWGAFAYVVNRKGAETILKANANPVTTAADDWAYFQKFGLKVFGVSKVLAGNFDFSRVDSSLSIARAEVARRSMLRMKKIDFVHRKYRAVLAYLRMFWWSISAVNTKGRIRDNSRVYKVAQRRSCD